MCEKMPACLGLGIVDDRESFIPGQGACTVAQMCEAWATPRGARKMMVLVVEQWESVQRVMNWRGDGTRVM